MSGLLSIAVPMLGQDRNGQRTSSDALVRRIRSITPMVSSSGLYYAFAAPIMIGRFMLP